MLINSQLKYSPRTLDEFVFPNDSVKSDVMAYVSGAYDQPLVLHGNSGTGKSLLQHFIPSAIEGKVAVTQKALCADIKKASDIHDLYGRNKTFNRNFTVNDQRYNYVVFEEFLITNKKINDAMKIEIDKTRGTDLTLISTNRLGCIDQGILSRSWTIEIPACDPHTFFPHAKKIFTAEGIDYDDAKLLQCLHATYTVYKDNRKYYEAIDRIFRSF